MLLFFPILWLFQSKCQSTYAKLGCTQGWFMAPLFHPPSRSVHVNLLLITQIICMLFLCKF